MLALADVDLLTYFLICKATSLKFDLHFCIQNWTVIFAEFHLHLLTYLLLLSYSHEIDLMSSFSSVIHQIRTVFTFLLPELNVCTCWLEKSFPRSRRSRSYWTVTIVSGEALVLKCGRFFSSVNRVITRI